MVAGGQVVLECKISETDGLWTFTPYDASTSIPIVKDCAVLEPFSDQYAVDTSDGGCNLLINNVKLNQSGTYACRVDQSPEAFATSEVLILRKFLESPILSFLFFVSFSKVHVPFSHSLVSPILCSFLYNVYREVRSSNPSNGRHLKISARSEPLANSDTMSTLTIHCQWEDGIENKVDNTSYPEQF